MRVRKKPRYCIVEEDQGQTVTVRMHAAKQIAVGTEFKLYSDKDFNTIETWRMTAEDNGYVQRSLRSTLSKIHTMKMSWGGLVCSYDRDIFDGLVTIEVFQHNHLCKMTEPVEQYISNIPPCKINNPVSFEGSLIFVVKKSESK